MAPPLKPRQNCNFLNCKTQQNWSYKTSKSVSLKAKQLYDLVTLTVSSWNLIHPTESDSKADASYWSPVHMERPTVPMKPFLPLVWPACMSRTHVHTQAHRGRNRFITCSEASGESRAGCPGCWVFWDWEPAVSEPKLGWGWPIPKCEQGIVWLDRPESTKERTQGFWLRFGAERKWGKWGWKPPAVRC